MKHFIKVVWKLLLWCSCMDCVQWLSCKFRAWVHSATRCYPKDVYGTYSCRVVQDESKVRWPSSVWWIVYEIQLMLLKSCGRSESANCRYLWMKVQGMWLNDTCTAIIFFQKGMFSASFSAKTNTVWWIAWFLPAGKETVHVKMECSLNKKLSHLHNFFTTV